MSGITAETNATQRPLLATLIFNSFWGVSLLMALGYLLGVMVLPVLLIPALLQFYWGLHCMKIFSDTSQPVYKAIIYLVIGTFTQSIVCYISIIMF